MSEARLSPGIWIGDSSLFHSVTMRRYLLGLAAFLKQPLRLVPALLHQNEVPAQLTHGSLPTQARRIGSNLQLNHARADCLDQARREINDWLDRCKSANLIEVMETDDIAELARIRSQLDGFCYPNHRRERVPNDLAILSECVAIGADFIATRNFLSVNHEGLNSWVKSTRGFNHNLIGSLSDLSEFLLRDISDEILIVAGMTVSDRLRPLSEEQRSIDFFVDSLHRMGNHVMGARLQDRIEDYEESGFQSLIEIARELSKTLHFQQARQMNAELVRIRRDIRELWEGLTQSPDLDGNGLKQ